MFLCTTLHILFLLLSAVSIEAITPNHKIALDKYAQAMGHSNKEKEYLDNAGVVVAREVKEAESDSDSESEKKEPILDPESFNEFDFISKKGEGLFYPDGVKLSYAGQAFLAYLATAQTIDCQPLEKRDRILTYLQKNPQFKVELIKIIALLKQAEHSILELSWPLTEEEKEEQNNFFFNRSNVIVPDFITKRLIPQRLVAWCADYCSRYPKVFNFFNAIRHPLFYIFPKWAAFLSLTCCILKLFQNVKR
jgi:hypothetical protein